MLQHSTEDKITIRSKNQQLSGLRATMGMSEAQGMFRMVKGFYLSL